MIAGFDEIDIVNGYINRLFRRFLFAVLPFVFFIATSQNKTEEDKLIDSLNRQFYLRSDNPAFNADSCLTAITDISNRKNYRKGLAEALYNYGFALEMRNQLDKAFEHYLKSLKIAEEIKFSRGMTDCYMAIAIVYRGQGLLDKAIEYSLKGVNIEEQSDDLPRLGWVYNSAAVSYYQKLDYRNAIKYYQKAQSIYEKRKDSLQLAIVLTNIGASYLRQGNSNAALINYLQAYDITKAIGEKNQFASICVNLADLYNTLNRLDVAEKYMLEGIRMSEENGFLNVLLVAYKDYTDLLVKKKDFEKAFRFHKLEDEIRDSMLSIEQTRNIEKLNVEFETEKKEKENEVLRVQKANAELTANKQRLILFGVSGVTVLIGALMFFILRAYRQKKRSNRELEIKNIIIEEKNRLVETKNKDISDSIHYAQRIQAAILPPDKLWLSILPDSFVLYKPKDILSGDFYWIEETPTHIFFAAADCTGHGVPGALMSIVNFNLLNKAVLEKSMTDPGRILDAVNGWLTESLHQTYQESTVRDGMDIALCTVEKGSGKMFFAAANNPVYLVKNDGLKILDGDHFPVGAFIDEKPRSFTTVEISADGSEHIYIFTDGFADQFGGPKGKKFKYKQLQEKIVGMRHMTLQKQKHELSRIFDAWKGDFEQVDDVLIIGVRVF